MYVGYHGTVADRPPAPAPLELVRQLVNTRDLESGDDALATPADAARWLRAHGLFEPGVHITANDATRLCAVREAIRALLLANNGGVVDAAACAVLNRAADRCELGARFDPDGTIGVAGRGRGIDGVIATVLAIVLGAVADGSWSRLKACRGDECHWAFYDRSRNRLGQWCVMAVCGNRSKARAYRERRKEPR